MKQETSYTYSYKPNSGGGSGGKGFHLNYNPEANWRNVYARKVNQPLPEQKE